MKNLPKDFKLVALAIFGIMLLYSVMEYNKSARFEQSIQESINSEIKREKRSQQLFESSKVMLTEKSKQLNLLLNQVNQEEMKTAASMDEILSDVISVIVSEQNDSILKLDETSVLGKLNEKNTMVFVIDEMKDAIDLKRNAYQLLHSQSGNEHNDQILGFEPYSDESKTIDLIKLCKEMKYVVFVQTTHYVVPQMRGSESFEPGLYILKYELFDVSLAKKLREGKISVENSSQVQSIGNDMLTFLKSDLENNRANNLKKFINKPVY